MPKRHAENQRLRHIPGSAKKTAPTETRLSYVASSRETVTFTFAVFSRSSATLVIWSGWAPAT